MQTFQVPVSTLQKGIEMKDANIVLLFNIQQELYIIKLFPIVLVIVFS